MPTTTKVLSKEQRQGRIALGQFIQRRLDEEFPKLKLSGQCKQIAQDTGLDYKTIERIVKGTTSTSVDTLYPLARRLGCSVSDMITPPKTPPPSRGLHAN